MSHSSEVMSKNLDTPRNSRRVGLLGGTFDPPHVGHLVLADQVRFQRHLDEVWLVVANDPWQKTEVAGVTPATERFLLVNAAIEGRDGLFAADVELQLGGVSTTAGTLRHLAEAHPDTSFEVIVGSDAASGLDTWKEPDWLRANARFVAVNRAGQPGAAPVGFSVVTVQMPLIEVSSTDIRRRFAEGEPTRFLVPDAVCDLVTAKGLYSSAQ